MGLVTVAAGYHIADFGRPEDPMALEWKHLPDHPDKLLCQREAYYSFRANLGIPRRAGDTRHLPGSENLISAAVLGRIYETWPA